MKKAIQFLSLALCGFVLSSFIAGNSPKKAYESKYYVAYAKENYANGKRSNFAVTNVVYLSCDNSFSETTVTNQLYTYYNAYYKSYRNSISFGGRGDILAFEFDTRSQAETKRRELIAKFNANNDILLIEKFTVFCED